MISECDAHFERARLNPTKAIKERLTHTPSAGCLNTTYTHSEKFNVHSERASLSMTYTLSETEPEPQGGDYLSAEP